MEELAEENGVDLPEKYAELERIEDGYATIVVLEPTKTDNVRIFPPVAEVRVAKYPVEDIPDEFTELDRFQVRPEDEGSFTVEEGGEAIDIEYDERLTNKITNLIRIT